jgi:hypothetical protein
MMEAGVFSNGSAVAALVAISFFSFVTGMIFRKWPEKVQEFAENVDGFGALLTPAAHRALIQVCGFTLSLMSVAALLATGAVL